MSTRTIPSIDSEAKAIPLPFIILAMCGRCTASVGPVDEVADVVVATIFDNYEFRWYTLGKDAVSRIYCCFEHI